MQGFRIYGQRKLTLMAIYRRASKDPNASIILIGHNDYALPGFYGVLKDTVDSFEL